MAAYKANYSYVLSLTKTLDHNAGLVKTKLWI